MIILSAFSDEAGSALSEQIDALKRNDIRMTELRGVDGKNVSKLTEAEAKEAAAKLSDNGISLSALGSPMGKEEITLDFTAYLDQVRHMCVLSNILGTDKIRMFSFYNAYDRRSQVIDYLNQMVETAKEYGITLCHENEKNIYGDTLERVLDLQQHVPGMKLIYDPANFLQVGEPAEKTLPVLHGLSEYFHIKDVITATAVAVSAR